MAEGWAKQLKSEFITPYSAGTAPHGVNRLAVVVMKEAGVDISSHSSKYIADLADIQFDYVVTLCGDADKNCPTFHTDTKVVHIGFPDPPKLAINATSDEEALPFYREVRDQIKIFVMQLPWT